jgi:hypothetical protein
VSLTGTVRKGAFRTYGYIFEKPQKAELQKIISNKLFYLVSRIAPCYYGV